MTDAQAVFLNPLDYDEKDDIHTAQVTKGAEALRAPAQHRTKKAKKKREEKKRKIIKSTVFPNSSFIIFESRVRHTGCDCQVGGAVGRSLQSKGVGGRHQVDRQKHNAGTPCDVRWARQPASSTKLAGATPPSWTNNCIPAHVTM